MAKQKTHSDYIKILKEKNIDVKPLEEYNGSKNKILHKCTCGNEWLAAPNNILNNCKCKQCSNKIKSKNYVWSNNDYITKLNNIKKSVIPLEEYKGYNNKILHRCTCGNEWLATPKSVINGTLCGCKNKITKEYYLKEINNIDVYMLEEYKGYNNKILHRCTCGNEWLVTPNNVAAGTRCGCNNNKKNSITYINELKERNISVIPLEEYNGTKNKILHRCTCGNEWLATPNSIKQGVKCGCRYNLSREKLYYQRPVLLYYIKINGIFKIGVTLHEKYKILEESILKQRYGKKYLKEENIIKIIAYKLFKNGTEAYILEQKIKNKFKINRYVGENFISPTGESGGETECFREDIYDNIKDIFNG